MTFAGLGGFLCQDIALSVTMAFIFVISVDGPHTTMVYNIIVVILRIVII